MKPAETNCAQRATFLPQNQFASALMFVGAVLIAAPVNAIASDEAYRCQSGAAERSYSILLPDQAEGGGCHVLYETSKSSPPRSIWRAKYDMQFCVDKMRESMSKLAAAGWNCEIAEVKLTLDLVAAGFVDKAPAQGERSVQPVQRGATRQPGRQVSSTSVSTSATAVATTATPVPKASVSAGPAPEFDDWLYRWDEARRRLVFTLYNKTDGTKVRSFSWQHRAMSAGGRDRPNIIFVENPQAKPLLIIAWPGEQSQYVAALDPLRQDTPFCELESVDKSKTGWGFGIRHDAVVLTGQRAAAGDAQRAGAFEQVCEISK
ncbi:MAG: hypothetical protein WBD34_16430 [Burkholderiaceae bacterium]